LRGDEMKIYAQLDEENVCVAVSQLSGPVEDLLMADVTNEENPGRFLGMRYSAGLWEDVPAPELPPAPHQPTNAELAGLINGVKAAISEVEAVVQALASSMAAGSASTR
jgi:hypothetical protein